MPKQLHVVAAVIVRNGRVLAAQRNAAMSLPNLWEFPGGKIEPGESPRAALVRELHEELGCTVSVGAPIVETRHEYDFATIVLATYYASIDAGEPAPIEHAEVRWCTAPELRSLDWAAADLPAVAAVASQLEAMQQ
ncbi:DNA mismatch repair protein MutT [Microbacterium sp. Root1433D1]|nr:DNA mismatch repair protein MutT [Microbacterium sp. Root1433D1]